MARRVELRPISDYEGDRLLRIVRRSSGSVVTRRAQVILLAAEVTFTSEDRVATLSTTSTPTTGIAA